jgi:hypothetical protein
LGQRISRVHLPALPEPEDVEGELHVTDDWPIRGVELRDELVLHHRNQEVRLPRRAVAWFTTLRFLAGFDAERAVAIEPALDADHKLTWLAALLRARVVVPRAARAVSPAGARTEGVRASG